MDFKAVVAINSKLMDDLYDQLAGNEDLDYELDFMLGIKFLYTKKFDYYFEIINKEKFLWAKLTYDI